MTRLNPQPFGTETAAWVRSVYEPLVTLQDGKFVNTLAKSTDLAADGKSLTITLQPNVTYSDGTPFNAAAVLWNINWMKKPTTGAQGIAQWAQVTASKVDDLTVKLTFPRPMPSIYGLLDGAVMVKPDAPDKGIGTGPFMVSKLTAGTSIALVANPKYWDKANAARLSSLTFQNYPDPSTAAVALQSNTIGMTNPAVQQIAGLKAAGMQSVNLAVGGNQDILINTTKKPLDDPRVRRALSLAFDRAGFTSSILGGLVKPAYSIFPPSSPAYSDSGNSGKLDLDTARSLLAQAGVNNLSISIDAPAVLPVTQFLPVYKQDLAKVGVTLTIHQIDTASWSKEASTGSFPELLAHAYNFGNSDPALLFTAFPFRPVGNASRYDNKDYQSIVSAAAVDLDPNARISKYQAIDQFVQQQAFMFPVAPIPSVLMYSPKYTAPKALGDGLITYNSVSAK
ncbi:ABC transporter substrate-binding protein [Kribbella sp. CA-245084]|uniref:ABC transporter substrate-binding protein n=1 Tax=Kribbella sp. CA-245084 TaxID=3239940 RepID=UPI003D950A15